MRRMLDRCAHRMAIASGHRSEQNPASYHGYGPCPSPAPPPHARALSGTAPPLRRGLRERHAPALPPRGKPSLRPPGRGPPLDLPTPAVALGVIYLAHARGLGRRDVARLGEATRPCHGPAGGRCRPAGSSAAPGARRSPAAARRRPVVNTLVAAPQTGDAQPDRHGHALCRQILQLPQVAAMADRGADAADGTGALVWAERIHDQAPFVACDCGDERAGERRRQSMVSHMERCRRSGLAPLARTLLIG